MKKYISGINNKKSDCTVIYSVNSKKIEIKLNSKLNVLYGKSIIKTAKNTLKNLGINKGTLKIDDYGALPFVIEARIEAAIKKAYKNNSMNSLPPMQEHAKYKTTFDRLRRSRLYIPGNQTKLMLNAGIHKPDGIILDLEDSIAPDEKDSARLIVRNALRTLDFFGAERMVRINQGKIGLSDLEAIIPCNVHVVLVPKVETPDQIVEIDNFITSMQKNTKTYIMPIIESALGLMNALPIVNASDKIVALTIGLEDYTADLGIERTSDDKESMFAKHIIVNAAKAKGVQAIDTVFSDVKDMKALAKSVKESKQIGFEGKGCIHPRQIKVIHDNLMPSMEEIIKAQKIKLAFDKAQDMGLSVVNLGSKMIDPPVVKRSLKLIKFALNNNLINKNWKNNFNG